MRLDGGGDGPDESVDVYPNGAIRPIDPARYLETRTGPDETTFDGEFQHLGRRTAGSITEIEIAGRGDVSDDVAAVLVNLTAVAPDADGYLTLYPCDADGVPNASTVNYRAGEVVPNAALVEVGGGGRVCVFTLAATDILLDVNGYVPVGSSPLAAEPIRIYESRTGPGLATYDGEFLGQGRRGAGSITRVEVGGRVCPCDLTSVFVNVTAVAPEAPGFLTVFDCTGDVPNASHVNYGPGDVVPNLVLAPLNGDGEMCVFTLAETDLVIDLSGATGPGREPTAATPARLLETRDDPDFTTVDGEARALGRRSAGSTYELQVAGRGPVPAEADTVMLNVTAVAPSAPGFLTVYPCGDSDRPNASNVNYGPGDIAPNAVVTAVGADGTVCVFTLAETDLLVDVSGYQGG